MQLTDIKQVHMTGIRGTGMSALALVLRKLGIRITGSDYRGSFLLLGEKNFMKAGINTFHGFNARNVSKNIDALIVTTAYNTTSNPEVKKAISLKIPVLTYPEMLSIITKEIPSIAVTGTHGKTTMANLLSHILLTNSINAIALSGPTSQQVIDELGAMGEKPELFVFEADEYENKLKRYKPQGVLLTNIELDHPDYFKTETQYKNVFINFIKRIPKTGFLIYCADDKNARAAAKYAKCKTFSYGISKYATFRIHPTEIQEFMVENDTNRVRVSTPLLGIHNMLNATGALIAANLLGISNKQFQKSLKTFKGSVRRLQKISSKPLIYDDYGHHPTEIKSALSALREKYPDKEIWAVFQAHTFTRTKKFLKEFGKSFKCADHVIVLDIWGSAREKKGRVHAKDIVKEIEKNKGTAYYIPTYQKAAKFLKQVIDKKSLILTIGASDIWKIHKFLE